MFQGVPYADWLARLRLNSSHADMLEETSRPVVDLAVANAECYRFISRSGPLFPGTELVRTTIALLVSRDKALSMLNWGIFSPWYSPNLEGAPTPARGLRSSGPLSPGVGTPGSWAALKLRRRFTAWDLPAVISGQLVGLTCYISPCLGCWSSPVLSEPLYKLFRLLDSPHPTKKYVP